MLQFSGFYFLAIVGVRSVQVRPAVSSDHNPNPYP